MADAGMQVMECTWCGRKFIVRCRDRNYSLRGVLCWNRVGVYCSEECVWTQGLDLPPALCPRFSEDEAMEKVARSLVESGLPDLGIRLLELLQRIDPSRRRYPYVLSKFLSIAHQRETDAVRRERLGRRLRETRQRLDELEDDGADRRTW